MQSQTIGEVERLLRTEMEDLDQFYQEFGEQEGEGQQQGTDLSKPSGLRNSTKFMKSGDFFEYIENMVEEDVGKQNMVSLEKVEENVSVPFEEEVLPKMDMSQARNLDVEMNAQSTFLGKVKQRSLQRLNRKPKREMREQIEMREIREEEEVHMLESDEPESPKNKNQEPTWRRDNDFAKSIDERVISTKKKTFEQLLEEALQKEGQSFVNPPEEEVQRRKTNFLKKNTSRRRFLNKKTKAKSKYGRANFKKKKVKKEKPKKEKKPMTESMLEFEQMEQINGHKSSESIGQKIESIVQNQVSNIEEEISRESEEENEEMDYQYLKMGKNKENEEDEEDDEDEEDEEDEEKGEISEKKLKMEIAKVKRQVEAKFKKKIDELNREIRKYKSRNKTLEEDKKKISKMKKRIEEDKLLVDRLKADKADFENYKQKEMEKLKREKAATKRNAKAYRATANKRDKETIDNLKKEMRILREQASNKEKKMKEAIERRKRKINELRTDNEELRSQVDFYEKMRMNQNQGNGIEQQRESLDEDEESIDENEENEESGESDEESTRNVRSLKTAIEKLSKKKGKKDGEMKKFLADFYAGFDNPVPNVDKGTLKINNENYKFDENTHYKKYKWNRENDLKVVQEEESEGKVYKTFADGRKEIKFSNGAVKEIMPDGYIIGIFYKKKYN